ncbi:hypothetical protein L9F63_015940, partial [Diploptera punctata]
EPNHNHRALSLVNVVDRKAHPTPSDDTYQVAVPDFTCALKPLSGFAFTAVLPLFLLETT